MAVLAQSRTTDRRGALAHVDWWFLGSSVLLTVIGLLALYSEGLVRDGGANYRKQIFNIVLGIGPFAAMALVQPSFWRRIWKLVYGVNLLSLVAVLALGASKKGAERWIPLGPIQVQPSEFSKLLIVLTLAAFLADRYDDIKKPSTFLLAGLHVLVPVGLIMLQPHLGASLVILSAWVAVLIVSGVPLKYLAVTAGVFVLLLGLVATPMTRKLVLRPYQEARVVGLMASLGMGGQEEKDKSRRGKNWQADQAAIAFGVGGVAGQGFKNGERKRAGFIPEQHNDFVLTVIGEEFGLLGCTIVLGLFGLFLFRCWLAIYNADNPYHRMIAAGVLAVIAFHALVNIAMVLQIVPVVGLWLPFISYGGTAMWLCMGCVGLILNLRSRERPVLF